MPISDSNLEGMFTFESEATPVPDEPPFHVLFVGDWSGDGPKRDLDARTVKLIDRDNFDEMIERFETALELSIGGASLRIEFREIDDFHPDNLYRNLPVFAELRDIRRRLKSQDTFGEAAAEVRSWFGGDAKPERETADAGAPSVSLDDILSGTASKRGEESELSRLISEIVEPHLIRIDEDEQAKLISAVDTATSDLMRSILRHPRFQQLESAWRGLYFAVRRIDTDVDLKLFVLDVTKDEFTGNLKTVNNLSDSLLFREAVRERVGVQGADPFSLICANYTFEPGVDDIAALMRAAKIAEAAGAPIVSMMTPKAFGIADFARLPEPAGFQLREDSNEAKLWNALRAAASADRIGLVPMRFMVRVPYGADSDPIDGFEFEENSGPIEHGHYLWTNPAFVCAVLLAGSYRANGWEMGSSLIHDVGGLPLYYEKSDAGKTLKPCAESWMTEIIVDRLLESGLMPLVAFRDSDRVRLVRFQSVALPAQALRGRWSH